MPVDEKQLPRYYWDADVLLSIINANPDRMPVLNAILDDAQNGKIEIYTSMLSIVEVAWAMSEKDTKALDPEINEKIDNLWRPPSPIKLVDIYPLLVYEARELMRQSIPYGWSLTPIDAIHLASGRRMDISEFHTYDSRLTKFSKITGYKVLQPHTDRLTFPHINDEKK